MAEKTISVRTALMPAYYKDFHCIMGACQDTVEGRPLHTPAAGRRALPLYGMRSVPFH